jgi:hypothetical protein
MTDAERTKKPKRYYTKHGHKHGHFGAGDPRFRKPLLYPTGGACLEFTPDADIYFINAGLSELENPESRHALWAFRPLWG